MLCRQAVLNHEQSDHERNFSSLALHEEKGCILSYYSLGQYAYTVMA